MFCMEAKREQSPKWISGYGLERVGWSLSDISRLLETDTYMIPNKISHNTDNLYYPEAER